MIRSAIWEAGMFHARTDEILTNLLPTRSKSVVPVVTVYEGLYCHGDVVERGRLYEALRANGCSVGLFETAGAAAAALVDDREAKCFRDE